MPPPAPEPPPIAGLPIVTRPVRLNDLPGLLAPYAVAAPVFVYLLASGHVLACRMRRQDKGLTEDDLILVLTPRSSAMADAAQAAIPSQVRFMD